ncbi:hypothetical protein HYPSUDRAFT_60029 [Hypholoma sublateritium FD-334 SS-4]|uniref:Uncharacterized protein n=1 Tax=Hypholoma sublateritium (strain FD-334 SS-4) TaxID=945553 RepID=A0A0D2KFP3_HYPSF|nr:hypothetical protein HYPSUDRAFT_60029 [Hypholoma sublateritium FD-334 SS-4]
MRWDAIRQRQAHLGHKKMFAFCLAILARGSAALPNVSYDDEMDMEHTYMLNTTKNPLDCFNIAGLFQYTMSEMYDDSEKKMPITSIQSSLALPAIPICLLDANVHFVGWLMSVDAEAKVDDAAQTVYSISAFRNDRIKPARFNVSLDCTSITRSFID